MKKYSVTFYDLIGYLVPGLFLALVVAATASTLLDNKMIFHRFYTLKWPWHLAIAYVAGHAMQAIATIALPFNVSSWWRGNDWAPDLKKNILYRLENEILERDKSETIPENLIVHLAEAAITLDHQIERADTFRALQGFFRAMTGVFSLVTIVSCLFFFFRVPFIFYVSQEELTFPPSVMGLLALLSGTCVLLFYYRFRRFAEYRLRTIFLSYYAYSTVKNGKIRTSEE
jgi:hypothetical protein